MRPDEWADALETESAHADPAWAREARRLAWRQRVGQDLRQVMSLRPLSRLLIVSLIPVSGRLATQIQMPSELFSLVHPLAHFLGTNGLGFLLLMVWLTRYVFLGYSALALALAAALLSPLGLLLLLGTGLRSAVNPDLSHFYPVLVFTVVTNFVLLIVFGWALATLRQSKTGVSI